MRPSNSDLYVYVRMYMHMHVFQSVCTTYFHGPGPHTYIYSYACIHVQPHDEVCMSSDLPNFTYIYMYVNTYMYSPTTKCVRFQARIRPHTYIYIHTFEVCMSSDLPNLTYIYMHIHTCTTQRRSMGDLRPAQGHGHRHRHTNCIHIHTCINAYIYSPTTRCGRSQALPKSWSLIQTHHLGGSRSSRIHSTCLRRYACMCVCLCAYVCVCVCVYYRSILHA
jgi:hypothetical protein